MLETENNTIDIAEDRSGYKKTKLGWIPKEWDFLTLSEIAKIKRGRFSPRPRNNPKYYDGEFPFVQTGDVANSNGYITTHSQTLNQEGLAVSILFPEGTILMTIAANIGHSAILDYAMACPDSLIAINCNESIDNVFLNFSLNQIRGRLEYLAPAGAQKNLNVEFLSTIKLNIPSFLEQKAIANCLSIWDTAITKQTQFIAAKLQLKKALMQQLLSGKKRLLGFDGEWSNERFDTFLEFTPRPFEKPDVPFTKLGIRSHCKGTFQHKGFEPQKIAIDTLFLVKPNDLIVNITFAWEGAVAIVKDEDEGALVSHRFPTYTFIEEISDSDFFKQFIQSKRFRYLLEIISPGGAGRNRVLSKKELNKLQIKIPFYKEQKAIGEVLSSADKEINLLNEQLEQLKEQKKGLMQQLLTGKKRLKF